MAYEEHGAGDPALRAEHDDLARRLAARASVDRLRRAGWMAFLSVMFFGLCWGLVWELHGETPTARALEHPRLFDAAWVTAFVLWLSLGAGAAVNLVRSRRMAREEDRLFGRLRELRRALGIDP